MKCPVCGKWNRSSQPRCFYCGAAFESEASSPPWINFNQKNQPKSYISVNDNGEEESAYDSRDILASEMADLKIRKSQGRVRKQQLVASSDTMSLNTPRREVRKTSTQSSFFMEAQGETDSAKSEPISIDHEKTDDIDDSAEMELNPADLAKDSYYDSIGENNVYQTWEAASAASKVNADRSSFGKTNKIKKTIRKDHRKRKLFISLACFLLVAGAAVFAYFHYNSASNTLQTVSAEVSLTLDSDGLMAHIINIPGKDGQRITIREIRSSAIVTDGVASFTISDHTWYDDYEQYLEDTMRVTLSPFIIEDNGKQTALQQIQYDIDIPISPIELDTPSTAYQSVATTLYNIVFYVQPGAVVEINGEDFSDLVDADTGKVSYNASVQPIGENTYTIKAKSQYCRQNALTVTLYRAKQDIPLDLASDISSTSSSGNGTMKVTGTTLPGAVIKVLSSHTDLDITETAINGNFSFIAQFDTIGDNTIVITADYPGKNTTRIEHVVHYVPNIDIYSRKAWDIVSMYQDLIDRIDIRKQNTQIYVCSGEITSIDTTKPQRCFMNVGTEESPLVIYVENSSQTTWEVGKRYRLYGDAYGMYDSKPWLIVRYTYDDE